jgi:hypothetical protein
MTPIDTPAGQVELKPCPFCGSKDIDPAGWMSAADSGPACDDCGASAGTINGRDNLAAWNTRASIPSDNAAEVERPILVEWVVQLAKRDIQRSSTDFVGRMQQAMCEFERICDEYPNGDWPEDERDNGGEALAALAGLALAQLAIISDQVDPLKALATPTSSPAAVPEATPTIPAGMKPWHGGDSAPEDWDGGDVLLRSGGIQPSPPTDYCWGHGWLENGMGDIIAYTPLAASQPVVSQENDLRLAREDADALDGIAEEADENGWLDWGAIMRQSASRIRTITSTGAGENGEQGA